MRQVLAAALLLVLGSGCIDPYLRETASRELDCPSAEVKLNVDSRTARAEGCGRLILFDRICQTTFSTRPSTTVHIAGRYEQKCGYEGFGTRSYRCHQVWVPGTTSYIPSKTESHTTCQWVLENRRWRQDEDKAQQMDEGAHPAWEKRYRPGGGRGPSSVSPPPTKVVEPLEPTPNRVVIADLGDFTRAEALLRRWVNQPVRLALSNGTAYEGVLRYVRTYTLWFTDGTELRLEDILVAEKLAIP